MWWRFDQSAKQLLVGHMTNHYATMLFILLLLLNYKFWNDVHIYCRPNCQYNTDLVVFWYSIMTVLYYFCCRMSIYWREMPPEPWHFVNWGIYWIHTHTHPFNGPLSRTTQVSQYQKGKTNLDFTEAKDSEWQWHQLGHMQVCTSLQTDNHTSTPPLKCFTGRMPFLPPNQQCQSTEGTEYIKSILNTYVIYYSR